MGEKANCNCKTSISSIGLDLINQTEKLLAKAKKDHGFKNIKKVESSIIHSSSGFAIQETLDPKNGKAKGLLIAVPRSFGTIVVAVNLPRQSAAGKTVKFELHKSLYLSANEKKRDIAAHEVTIVQAARGKGYEFGGSKNIGNFQIDFDWNCFWHCAEVCDLACGPWSPATVCIACMAVCYATCD